MVLRYFTIKHYQFSLMPAVLSSFAHVMSAQMDGVSMIRYQR
jgi:hypothetical protein